MSRHIIITTCTNNKSTVHAPGAFQVTPTDYLTTPQSAAALARTRAAVWAMPGSGYNPADSQHYAFDLYVGHPKTQLYQNLRAAWGVAELREALLKKHGVVEWFFLSAGYGLLHAFELARPYQASFTRGIASENGIPYTGTLWKRVLPGLLDEVFKASPVTTIHVFGSTDYVKMVQATNLFVSSPAIFNLHVGRANTPSVRANLVQTVRGLI